MTKYIVAVFVFFLIRAFLKNFFEGWPKYKVWGLKEWRHKGLYGQEFSSIVPPREIEKRFNKIFVSMPDGFGYIHVLRISYRGGYWFGATKAALAVIYHKKIFDFIISAINHLT